MDRNDDFPLPLSGECAEQRRKLSDMYLVHTLHWIVDNHHGSVGLTERFSDINSVNATVLRLPALSIERGFPNLFSPR